MGRSRFFILSVLVCGFMFLEGSQTTTGNVGNLQTYAVPAAEADWIRNGEAVQFENELWIPSDDVETLLDSEVFLVGEYRGVQVFVEKTDVRPFNRLYTKFARDQFRFFEKKVQR